MTETLSNAIPRRKRIPRDRSYDDVTIKPRYMAGGSFTGDDAFVPLTYHYWHDMSDELGNFYVTTMNSQLRVAFIPEISELIPDATALWQIRARTGLGEPHVWSAAFTDETPPEIIAGMTAALDADVTAGHGGRDPYLCDDHPDVVWDVFRAAKWTVSADGWHVEAISPDTLASLAYRPPQTLTGPGVPRDEAWRATVRAHPGARRPLWGADFHSATPAHLIAAFATALTDPTPLTRERQTVPRECLPYARPIRPEADTAAPRTPTPLDVSRAQAAQARSTIIQPQATTSVPVNAVARLAWTSSSPPRPHR